MPISFLGLRRTYRSVNRIRQVVNVLLRHGFGAFIEQINLQRFIPIGKRFRAFGHWPYLEKHTIPERLRMAFTELGPSFIKLAQILSSRPDLITKAFADEFKKLQDEVPPFPFEDVMNIIREEFNAPLDDIFMEFEKTPVAAASIAQVHRATLNDGNKVVIKIQRPDIKGQIETDIDILRNIARLMLRYIPESQFYNPMGIVEEFSKTVRKELNFIEEGRNACRFRGNFSDNPNICIPKIFPDLLSERVIVMERLEGVRIDNIKAIDEMGIDRKELARVGVDAYFKMMLEDGFFHADPHPGNIFALQDGRIGLVDFGIVGWLTPDIMESIANAFLAIVNKDFDKLVDEYVALGLVSEDVDIETFRAEFKADLMEFLVPMYGLTLREINFPEYLDTITHLAIKHNLKIPSDLLLVNKAMLILDSIGRELDPDFNFMSIAEPYASKLIRKKYSPSRIIERARKQMVELGDFFVTTPKQLKLLLRKALKDELNIKIIPVGLDRLIRNIDRASNRVAFSVVIAAIIIGSSILNLSGIGGRPLFGISSLGVIGFTVAFFFGLWLLISILKSGRL